MPAFRVVFFLLVFSSGCSKSIRPDNNQSRGNGDTHDMTGAYSGYGSWVANGRTLDSSAAGHCILPNRDTLGTTLSNLPAKIYVSDDSKGHITVSFLKNVNAADPVGLYPGPKVVHYVISDFGDHAHDSVGDYYYDYSSKALRVHFSLPTGGGPCSTKESGFSVVNSAGFYIYLSVGSWDFAGSPD